MGERERKDSDQGFIQDFEVGGGGQDVSRMIVAYVSMRGY